jgi:hypothetical protein
VLVRRDFCERKFGLLGRLRVKISRRRIVAASLASSRVGGELFASMLMVEPGHVQFCQEAFAGLDHANATVK